MRTDYQLATRVRLGIVVFSMLAALLFSYTAIIDPLEYAGYVFEIHSMWGFATGVCLALLPVCYLPLDARRPSTLVSFLLYFLAYIPACTVPYCTGTVQGDRIWQFQLTLAVCFWLVSRTSRLPTLAIPHQALPKIAFWALVIASFLAAWAVILMHYGVNIRWVVFADVYDVRADFVDSVGQQNRMMTYLVPWLGNVIAPFLFIYSIRNRQWGLVFLVGASQVVVYTITAYKHFLFSIVFLILLYLAMRLRQGTLLGRLAVSCLAIVVVCTSLDLITGEALWTSFITRRLFLNSGLLTGFYFDFFSINPKFHLAHSVLRWFLETPYSTAAPLLIGETFIGAGCSANAHMWADAFANFGLPGMVVFSMVLSGVLWFYDSISRGCDHIFAALVLAIPAMALANTALLTTILTHGLGLAIALMFVAPREVTAERPAVPRGFHPQAAGLPTTASRTQLRAPAFDRRNKRCSL